mmetsp:Transcript_33703/g.85685  ORF Transcript_33703/g.85685 Transcript_33703/m.85685 type:complete len:245 (-) Transcript_33703:68-802(-)
MPDQGPPHGGKDARRDLRQRADQAVPTDGARLFRQPDHGRRHRRRRAVRAHAGLRRDARRPVEEPSERRRRAERAAAAGQELRHLRHEQLPARAAAQLQQDRQGGRDQAHPVRALGEGPACGGGTAHAQARPERQLRHRRRRARRGAQEQAHPRVLGCGGRAGGHRAPARLCRPTLAGCRGAQGDQGPCRRGQGARRASRGAVMDQPPLRAWRAEAWRSRRGARRGARRCGARCGAQGGAQEVP